MAETVFGVFMVLHGLVHLLYSGHSWRLFELQPGLLWPDGSWAFSRLLGANGTRWLAGLACLLAALGFATGGAAMLARWSWWRPLTVTAASFSAAIYLLFWDGGLEKLDGKGLIAILINLAILFTVLVLRWPASGL